MPTNTTTTGYLINRAQAEGVLRNTESLFTTITSIQKIVNANETLSTFTFHSVDVRQGTQVKHPAVNATKTEIATFLSNLSGQTVTAASIMEIVMATDSTFVEVIVS